MEENISSLNSLVADQIKNFFPNPLALNKAKDICIFSELSISYEKITQNNLHIISGVYKGKGLYQLRLSFKKASNENEDVQITQLKSQCECHEWESHSPCHHVAAFFLKYCTENQEILSAKNIFKQSTTSVYPKTYGTIVERPYQLVNGKFSDTFHSIHFHLNNNLNITLPKDITFNQTFVLNIWHKKIENQARPIIQLKYSYFDPINFVHHTNVSIFNYSHIFNWESGTYYKLPLSIINFLHSIRSYQSSNTIHDVNDILRYLVKSSCAHLTKIIINGQEIENKLIQNKASQKTHSFPTVLINRFEKTDLLKLTIKFPYKNRFLDIPHGLESVVIKNGLLAKFKDKKIIPLFVKQFFKNLRNDKSFTWKFIRFHQDREVLKDLLEFFIQNDHFFSLDLIKKSFYQFKGHEIRQLIFLIYKYFPESFYKNSEIDTTQKSLTFEIGHKEFCQHFFDLYQSLKKININIIFENKKVKIWHNDLTFKRINSSQDWFDFKIKLNKNPLSFFQNYSQDKNFIEEQDAFYLIKKQDQKIVDFVHRNLTQGNNLNPNPTENIVDTLEINLKKIHIFEIFDLIKSGQEGLLTDGELAFCKSLSDLNQLPDYPLNAKSQNIARNYQQDGYKWIRFLYENKFGACLADEMGLGKTIQAILFLEELKEKNLKVLIVCPKSLIFNWYNEFKKFSTLTAKIYHGENRSFTREDKEFNVQITSYGILKRDIDTTFNENEFDIVIYDEIQYLKNRKSQGSLAARKLKASFFLGLTGTPLENNIHEFFNIMDLCVPGIWTNNEINHALHFDSIKRVVGPFILRRLKKNVLSDLPDKLENTILLNFSDHEKKNYEKSLEKIRSNLTQEQSFSNYGQILKNILHLRQLCLWQQKESEELRSTKIDYLMDNLEELTKSGQQVLVFSQFTKYLDMIQDKIQKKSWHFARIDGSQSLMKRTKEVEKFQKGEAPIFLISLKAGGFGLNLTAANYIFLMDPWWNPSVENQAIDRAHRIGQERKVHVFRPIIKGTIEEKVLQLQQDKNELFQQVLSSENGKYFSGNLSSKDFEFLLS